MEKTKSRIKQTEKNVIFGFLYKFVILFLNFISRKFFIKYIGIDYLGINSLFSNILSILCLADLGMGVAMNYSLYKPLKEKNEKEICELINYYKKIYHIISSTVFILGISLIPFLDKIINLDREIKGVYIYYILFLIQTCSSYIMVYKSTLLVADQKNYINSFVTMIINIIKVVLQIIEIIIFHNYYIYIILEILGILISNAILSNIANKSYPYIKNNYQLPKEKKKGLLNNIKSVFIYKISVVLINSTDNILISTLISTTILGYYSNYYTVSNQLTPFLTIIFSSLTASIGNLIVSTENNKQYEIFRESTVIANYIGIILSVGFAVLIQNFIILWLGEEYLLDYPLVIAMTLNLFYSCINQPIWTYREAGGLYLKTKYIMLITAILNVALSIFLGKLIGISGIIFATVLSKLLVCFWYEPKLLFRDYFKVSSIGFFKMCVKQFIVFIICWGINYCIFKNIVSTSWILWIIKGIIVVCISTFIFILFNYKNEEFIELKKLIILILKNRLKRNDDENRGDIK